MDTLPSTASDPQHLAAPAAVPPETDRGADRPFVVYFSSVSGNTHKFVQKLSTDSLRLPLRSAEEAPVVDRPYVLCVPTYGRPRSGGSVPPQVMKFLRVAANRQQLRGVMGAGNTNFGELYCIAAHKIAAKCGVPLLYTFELMGTSEDVARVDEGLKEFWTTPRPLST